MNEFKDRFENVKEQMQQARDELKLQIHLGKVEAKQEWERLEKKRKELLNQTEGIGEVVDETAHNVAQALESALHELKVGYDNVRKKFK